MQVVGPRPRPVQQAQHRHVFQLGELRSLLADAVQDVVNGLKGRDGGREGGGDGWMDGWMDE
jgi:hypothetical protein